MLRLHARSLAAASVLCGGAMLSVTVGPAFAQEGAGDRGPSQAVVHHHIHAGTEGEHGQRHESNGERPRQPSHEEIDIAAGAASYEANADLDPELERNQSRGASQLRMDRQALSLLPDTDAATALQSLPGVYVARPEGDATGHQILVRGFDAEHGQDLELTLDGIPLNQVSHIHGQGYVDLSFLLPELIDNVRLTEGLYDPRQGDFATAGSIDFQLRAPGEGLRSRTTYGSFDTFRQMFVFSPNHGSEGTFVAAAFRNTNGFGAQRGSTSATVHAQYETNSEHARFRVFGILHGARGDSAGVLRRDDVAADRVGFFESYGFPTARAQYGSALRLQLGSTLRLSGHHGSFGAFALSYTYTDWASQRNYTGFTAVSQTLPGARGRGDLIRQTNSDHTFFFQGRYRSEAHNAWGLHGHGEVGVDAKLSLIEQSQDLVAAPLNQTWDHNVDASVSAGDVGAYADLDIRLQDRLRLRGGVRGDFLLYRVEDRLGNRIPLDRPETGYLQGFARNAFGLAVGPRATLEWAPTTAVRFSAAYGQGYRSPQARILVDGERAPFARTESADVGFTWLPLGPDASGHEAEHSRVQASLYYTHLSGDLAFDPATARAESIGPSTRLGATAFVRHDLWTESLPHGHRITLMGSFAYVRATVDAPPPPTLESPTPNVRAGDPVPGVPPWTLRVESRYENRIAVLRGTRVIWSLGLGASMLAPRPLFVGMQSQAIALLDAHAAIGWQPVRLELSVQNLLDARYAQMEYAFSSNWDPTGAGTRVPVRHLVAGAPLSFMATLEVEL